MARARRAFHHRGGRARADRCRLVTRAPQRSDRSAGRHADPPGVARRAQGEQVSFVAPMSKRSFRIALGVVIGSIVLVIALAGWFIHRALAYPDSTHDGSGKEVEVEIKTGMSF